MDIALTQTTHLKQEMASLFMSFIRSRSTPLFHKKYGYSTNANQTKHPFPLWRTLFLLMVCSIAVYQVRGYLRQPQAVLVLGGAPEREEFAAEFASQHPHLQVWVSSGSNPEFSEWVFEEAGIERDRLHLDYRAKDTVTNFTTLVDDFHNQGISSVYLITSDYHMRRAQVIAEIVLGSRDIDFKPISVPSERPPEPIEKVIRDGARAILWLTTGHTGATLGHQLLDHSG